VRSPQTVPAELLSALSAALSELGATWYLFGAHAAMVWGRPRLTADIDVTVRLEPEDPERLVRTLQAHGFALRVGDADDFIRRTRVFPFLHVASGMPLDIVLAGPGLEDLFLSRARPITMAGVVVPVICPEDLIATKILAGRAKDIEDVRGILRERLAELDVALIRSTLAALEDALAQSDLRPAFEGELARSQKEKR
jgi:hypothetical protein